MSLLELHRASKTYRRGDGLVRALAEVELALEPGELVALTGPSGAGKSSLLALAGGFETASSGEVLLAGVSLAELAPRERARHRRRWVGVVSQGHDLRPGLRLLENLTLPLQLEGMPSLEAQWAALAALEELGLLNLAEQRPGQLSGGQRQLAALARAVVSEPRLLLADEPASALDHGGGEAVMRWLRAASRRGAATLVATHDPHLACWADRVLFLRGGRLVDETCTPTSLDSLLQEVAR